ncbi:MAG: O-antigen ligase family protein [Bacteroidetes bacterium]|nr:O-antigen ligase family protein [Bacteroidota bacterium]
MLILSVFTAIITEEYLLMAFPAVVMIAYLCVVDFRMVFFLLVASIPLSTEYYFPNGFSTDLPTEPLMIGLMGAYLLYVLKNGKKLSSAFFRHPITLILLLHLSWIIITTLTSGNYLISVKFLLAKIWYVTTLYFLAGHILKTEKDFKRLFWFLLIPTLFVIVTSTMRHAAYGFSFEERFRVFSPFFRNHVAYAAVVSTLFPFLWFAREWYEKGSFRRRVLIFAVLLFFVAIQLSYTRAAFISIIIAVLTYLIIRFRLMKIVLTSAVIVTIMGASHLAHNNTYLDYAPNYERTIAHTQFDNLVEATYKMEDISTMERVYRWVAGVYMSVEKPYMGFGPGNFYNFYKPYTVHAFKTYVSDNPEKSGIHSYFLMILVEQGFPGLLIFVFLLFYALIKGEDLYHNTKNRKIRRIVLMVLLSMVVIDALLIINDLVETDKIGSLFFINLAVLVNMDLAMSNSNFNDNFNINSNSNDNEPYQYQ